MAMFFMFPTVIAVFQLYFLIHASLSSTVEPTSSICPGTCISKDSTCNTTIDNTNCGIESICCMDNFESTTEPGFDFSTLSSRNNLAHWMSTTQDMEFGQETEASDAVTELFETDEPAFFESSTTEGINDELYTTTSDEFSSFEQCPGACIPKKHSALCQYVIPSDYLCPNDKVCCATIEAAQKLQQSQTDKGFQDSSENECPGKCIHPSLTIFCNKILSGYNCPMDSRCCDKKITPTSEDTGVCTGECLSSRTTYLCRPPYELVPGTSNCKQSSVCCMRTSQENEYELPDQESKSAFSDSGFQLPNDFETSARSSGSGLASDENGQVYYVLQSGQFRPLPTVTYEESLNLDLKHFADVAVGTGKATLYRDQQTGALYQLSVIEPEEPDFQDFSASEFTDDRENYMFSPSKGNLNISPHEEVLKPIISAPDDSDDMEENLKDIVIPDEGEDLIGGDSLIPPGERTLIKPKCPGSCLSTLLRFTCMRKSTIYDGFFCPINSVCCASLTDVEEHEKYLASLSPYFKATPVENEENRRTCFAEDLQGDVATRDRTIAENCWQVALINEQNQYICGGVIIENSWVLTAAHCVTGILRQDEALYVRAGTTDLTDPTDSFAGQTRRALSVFVHHNHNSMSLDNDIALLRLQTPLELNVNVCIACLPTKERMPPDDSKCVVTGYGFISKAGTMSLKIHNARVSIIDDIDCIANVTDALATVFILPGSSFCAGGQGSNYACQGDAGGPLMCYNEGRNELTGLVSWSLGCGKDYIPSIYVKIPSFMNWINQIISASAFLKALS